MKCCRLLALSVSIAEYGISYKTPRAIALSIRACFSWNLSRDCIASLENDMTSTSIVLQAY